MLTFIEITVSNLIVAGLLATLATFVQRANKWPHLAHFLWLLVLIKLLLPPLFPIPLELSAETTRNTPTLSRPFDSEPVPDMTTILPKKEALPIQEPSSRVRSAPAFVAEPLQALPKSAPWTTLDGLWILLGIWAIGSIVAFAASIRSIRAFQCVIDEASTVAPDELQALAREFCSKLGLERSPLVLLSSARISPMLWFGKGQAQIIIPKHFVDPTHVSHLYWILGHECAHFARRDHYTRWIEWLATNLFWWNPLVWWAKKQLRINEEICCDSLVLSQLKPNPRQYAGSLLSVIEFLAAPISRHPALASGMNSGEIMERRFHMIISNTRTLRPPPWFRSLATLLVLIALPLGFAGAQDKDAAPTKKKSTSHVLAKKNADINDLKEQLNALSAIYLDLMDKHGLDHAKTQEVGKQMEALADQIDAEQRLLAKKVSSPEGKALLQLGVPQRDLGQLILALEKDGLNSKAIQSTFKLAKTLIEQQRSHDKEQSAKTLAQLKELKLKQERLDFILSLHSRKSPESLTSTERDRLRVKELLGKDRLKALEELNLKKSLNPVLDRIFSIFVADRKDYVALENSLRELRLKDNEVKVIVKITQSAVKEYYRPAPPNPAREKAMRAFRKAARELGADVRAGKITKKEYLEKLKAIAKKLEMAKKVFGKKKD